MRHDAVATLVMKAVLTALRSKCGDNKRYEVRHEVSLGKATSTVLSAEQAVLRPDAYLHDNVGRTVTPVEFTVPDDARLLAAFKEKHEKYSHILNDATPSDATMSFKPLAVVVVGTWGTVHQSAVNSLVRLGIPPEAITAILRKILKICAQHATLIARSRFAATRKGLPTAV